MTQTLIINGNPHTITAGTTVLAALNEAGVVVTRHSVHGEARAPLCGMGVCFECRVTINGRAQTRACMTMVEDDMTVETGNDNS